MPFEHFIILYFCIIKIHWRLTNYTVQCIMNIIRKYSTFQSWSCNTILQFVYMATCHKVNGRFRPFFFTFSTVLRQCQYDNNLTLNCVQFPSLWPSQRQYFMSYVNMSCVNFLFFRLWRAVVKVLVGAHSQLWWFTYIQFPTKKTVNAEQQRFVWRKSPFCPPDNPNWRHAAHRDREGSR